MEINLTDEKLKITGPEIIAVIVFSILFIWTQKYNISVMACFASFFGAIYIPKIVKKSLKIIKKWRTVSFIILISLFLIDTLSTYYAVHYMKFAQELNLIVLWLWNHFGLFWGEAVRISITFVVFATVYQKTDSKSEITQLIAYVMLLTFIALWFYVDGSNLLNIYFHFRG